MDTYISFGENICCAHTSYSLMRLFKGYVGYAAYMYIKKLFFNAWTANYNEKRVFFSFSNNQRNINGHVIKFLALMLSNIVPLKQYWNSHAYTRNVL